ncbi:MAG: hypothetical protein ACOYOF_01220 [Verrucomicrobiaceae bacterium]|jgi:hypothetical protein
MNDDLETKLQSMCRSELPAAWKAEILGSLNLPSTLPKSTRKSLSPTLAPPRWLAWSMAGAWTLVLILNWLTPATSPAPSSSIAAEVSTRALQLRREMLQSLLATNFSHTP